MGGLACPIIRTPSETDRSIFFAWHQCVNAWVSSLTTTTTTRTDFAAFAAGANAAEPCVESCKNGIVFAREGCVQTLRGYLLLCKCRGVLHQVLCILLCHPLCNHCQALQSCLDAPVSSCNSGCTQAVSERNKAALRIHNVGQTLSVATKINRGPVFGERLLQAAYCDLRSSTEDLAS